MRSVRSNGASTNSIFHQVSSIRVTFFTDFHLLLSLMQPSQFLTQITVDCDPVEWILINGKELERACEFAMALKYYFAGRMFFARLKNFEFSLENGQTLSALPVVKKWKALKYEIEFRALYEDLLPMTNAKASHGNE